MTSSLPGGDRELNLLHRISQVLGSDMGLSDVLQAIVSLTAELMESKVVSILLYDEGSSSLALAATQSLSPAYRNKPPVSAQGSISGRALASLSPQAVWDVCSDEAYGYRELARQEGIVSLLSVPMVMRGKAIGVINSYSSTPRIYGEDEVKLLALVAGQAAGAIENARLHSATAAVQADLEARRVLSKAKTLLMRQRGMDEPAAHRWLQKESMNRRRPMRAVAEELLQAEAFRTA